MILGTSAAGSCGDAATKHVACSCEAKDKYKCVGEADHGLCFGKDAGIIGELGLKVSEHMQILYGFLMCLYSFKVETSVWIACSTCTTRHR